MVCVICEGEYINNVWGKQKYDGLLATLKKRRIKYAIINELKEIKNIESDEPIIVIAIGADKSWYSFMIRQCNLMNLRIITFGDSFSQSLDGNYSCITSDLKSSTFDIYRYFSAYDKKNTALFGVNKHSGFDVELKKEILEFLPKNGINVDVFEKTDLVSDCVKEFLSKAEFYDSIICTNDYSAIILLGEIKKANPEYLNKVFLVSFSNTLLSLMYTPSITTFYETDAGVDYAIKIYYLLMQNPEISTIHFAIKEHIKIRETTQLCPYVSIENSALLESCDFIKEDVDVYFLNKDEFHELISIEKMLVNCDKTDLSILVLLLRRKRTLEIADILYSSRGSIRYRISQITNELGLNSKEQVVELLDKYICADSLCKYAEDILN